MKTERQHLEALAAEHDARADDLFADIANGAFTDAGKPDADAEAQAHRRAAEIIHYQLECEA